MNTESLMIEGDNDILKLLRQAFDALAGAESLEDYTNVRDTTEAIRVLARNAKSGLQVRNHIAELRLRAEGGAGSILRAIALRGGDRRTKTYPPRLTLSDLGITSNESTRWQNVAIVLEGEFCTFVSLPAESSLRFRTGRPVNACPLLPCPSSVHRNPRRTDRLCWICSRRRADRKELQRTSRMWPKGMLSH